MRRTQQVSSYAAMFLLLTSGVAFMVITITGDWVGRTVQQYMSWMISINYTLVGVALAFSIITLFYLLIRFRYTV